MVEAVFQLAVSCFCLLNIGFVGVPTVPNLSIAFRVRAAVSVRDGKDGLNVFPFKYLDTLPQ